MILKPPIMNFGIEKFSKWMTGGRSEFSSCWSEKLQTSKGWNGSRGGGLVLATSVRTHISPHTDTEGCIQNICSYGLV